MNNLGFWKTLKKPIMVLAPMADVTDAAFRRVIAKYGKPDVMWTEFVSADGLVLAPEVGRQKLLRDLMFTEAERPIVAQFFTSHPENMKKVAELARELGFDGIDINMGCPAGPIEKQGAGAALIKTPALARELIRAAKEGAESAGRRIPVSVKTRIGYNKNQLEEWLPELLAEEPAVITIHARTRKEMSLVPAQWEQVKRAVEIRDALQSETLIFGNGDAFDLADARKKVEETGADGVMLGRAIFGTPWLFSYLPQGHFKSQTSRPEEILVARELENRSDPAVIRKILEIMVEHTKLFEELLGDIKSFAIMKKHYKAYVTGWPEAKELRAKLMETQSVSEVEAIVKEYISAMPA